MLRWRDGRKGGVRSEGPAGSASGVSRPPDEAGAYRASAAPAELDDALDTLASAIRDVGRFAIDVGEQAAETVAEEAEAWAKHLLVLAPSPDSGGRSGERRRDFAGIRRFFGRHRRAESQQMAETLHGLRSVVWAFVRSLRHAVGETDTDTEVIAQLEALRDAARSGNPSLLEEQALAVADRVSHMLARRAEQQKAERAMLSEKLHTLGFQLEAVREEASKDPLTGVMNRGAFDAYVENTVDLSAAFDHEALLLLVDVDHFKRVNDAWGHPVGDQVLRALADRFVRTFLRKNDFIARYGGEEFAVVMRDAGAAQATKIGERLMKAVRSLSVELEDGERLEVRVSAGIAVIRRGETAKDWVARADRALYRAKNEGRDRYALAP